MASKLHASYVSILQRFSDILAIYIGLYISFKINNLEIDHQTLLGFLGLVSIFQCLAEVTDFYRHWRGVSLLNELLSTVQNIGITTSIFYLLSLFFISISLEMLFETFILLVLLMASCRIAIRIAHSLFFRIFDVANKVIVIGDSERAKKLFANLSETKWAGDQPIGLFSLQNDFHSQNFDGNLEDAIAHVRSGNIRKVYVVLEQQNVKVIDSLLKILSDTTCSTILVPDLFNSNVLYSRIDDINGVPVIPLFDTCISGINKLLKRLEDIVVASIILLLISPILLFISIAIKLDSKGPVFFKQVRYGLNGKSILVYKFRTMNVMENGTKVTQATKDDPRITRVGRILRRTSLDELPQFFNVIIGNMSVVGPRPHAVAHNEEYRKLINGYMLRHTVKPGITGLAQINGWRGETDTLDKMEKRIECDLEYIRTWSLILDIKIIFLTVFKGFIHKAAY